MARWARSKMLSLRLAEEKTFNVEKFLQGTLEISTRTRLTAYSALVAAEVEIRAEEIPWLQSLPEEEWLESDQPPGPGAPNDERLFELISQGVVIVEAGDDDRLPAETGELLARYQHLDNLRWHPDALHCHLVNQDNERNAAAKAEPLDLVAKTAESCQSAEEFVDRHGEPPSAFFHPPQGREPLIPLADGRRQGQLYEVLNRRRTLRAFDLERSLDPEHLATLLRTTFGCSGRHTLSPRFFSLHKSSPSGGSLHPIEAYPVIRDVAGFEPGFYHYDCRRHALLPLQLMAPEALKERVIELAQGQVFAAEAHFVVLMVARYHRNFWKYQRRLNTYNVILKDSGHLSQTFQLVATDLGLAPFYTGAIDPLQILDALGYNLPADRFEHGPIGILGAGVYGQEDQTLMPLEPFDPTAER